MPRILPRLWLMLLGLGVIAAGCAKPQGPSKPAAVSLNGAGATFPYPLYSKWFSEYHATNPQVQISYQSIGSGGGIQALKNRTVDFGASDAPLSDEEVKAMPAPVAHIPTVAGAVVVTYHLPGLARPLRLDGSTLAAVYLGQIKRWNDSKLAALNSGVKLPDLAITVAHRSDGSGTTYLFTHYLAAVSPEWEKAVGAGKSVNWPVGVGGKGNEGVAGTVKQLPGAIGYVELAYAKQNQLSYAELRNAAGKLVAPTVASTTAAAAGAVEKMKQDVRVGIVNSPATDAYPISGFTYLLVYQAQPDRTKGAALAQFLGWAMKEGQPFAAPLGYAPLPEGVVAINQEAIRKLTPPGKPLTPEH
jgi:phosphate transport system substrate-binding protein